MQDNSKKIFDFIKSLFLPRKMARHMNMRFVLSLLILIIASCLNIVTSNTRAGKDTEKALEFPSLFEELPDDLVLTEMTTNEPMTRLTVEEANGSIEVTVDGVVQKIESLSKYLKADKNGVYHTEKLRLGQYYCDIDKKIGECIHEWEYISPYRCDAETYIALPPHNIIIPKNFIPSEWNINV